jgi:hypothetical protein
MKRFFVILVLVLTIAFTVPVFSDQKGFKGTIGDLCFNLSRNCLRITMIVDGRQVSPSPFLYFDNEASKAAAQLLNLALINKTSIMIQFDDKGAKGREHAVLGVWAYQ